MSHGGTTEDAPFAALFRPTPVAGRTAKNAVKLGAEIVSNYASPDGSVSPRLLAHVERLAATGAGIVTNEGAWPEPEGAGRAYGRQLSIAEDRFVEGLAQVVARIHAEDALALQQILHAGRYGGFGTDHCLQASDTAQALPALRPPRAVKAAELRAVIGAYVAAAGRAAEAGFDGVEIDAAGGSLPSTFLSPFTNHRSDAYGGPVENRARFLVELLEAVRAATTGRILFVRLCGDELLGDRGGSTPDECLEVMRRAEGAGADGISLTAGWRESRIGALGRELPGDHWLHLARRAKAAVSIPVAFGPRLDDPARASGALETGGMDLWESCRPFLADPQLLAKLAGGRMREIRPCTGGLTCLARMHRSLPVICGVNPELGREDGRKASPAARRSKRVLVIGGGPAGMECALTARRRGHDVTLLERTGRLGGQVRAASLEVEAGGHAFAALIQSYEAELAAAGVDVQLMTEGTPSGVRERAPDVVVVATGAEFRRLRVPGEELPLVVYGPWTVPEQIPDGERVVVLGTERPTQVLAERLAAEGRKVTILALDTDRLGRREGAPAFASHHHDWVRRYGIELITDAELERIADRGVFVTRQGRREFLGADRVIVTGPRRPLNDLARDLEYLVDELYLVGDAVLPRAIPNAIHEGHRTARAI